MPKHLAILVLGVLLAGADARAQSAGAALATILFNESAAGTLGALTEDTSTALYAFLLGETTTFPTGSSAGGFTWIFDSDLRVPVRRSTSFGPMFAERPFTTGKGRLNVGASFQHTRFESVGGQPLTALESSSSYAYGAVYRYISSAQVVLDRTIISATYGVLDKVDIGVIAPMGSATVSGFSSFYQFDDFGESTTRIDSSGSSFGIGDVVIRTKAALMASQRFDAAAALAVRLPTGDPDKLMGTGYTQAKIMFIGGSTLGSLTPHVNIGYTLGGSGIEFGDDIRWEGSSGAPELTRDPQPSEEFNYTVGADVAATPRITIAGDVIGRVVQNSAVFTPRDSGGPDRVIDLAVAPGTVHLLLGAVGAKVNVGGSWLATGTVLFPLNDNGITTGVTPVFGFERAF